MPLPFRRLSTLGPPPSINAGAAYGFYGMVDPSVQPQRAKNAEREAKNGLYITKINVAAPQSSPSLLMHYNMY